MVFQDYIFLIIAIVCFIAGAIIGTIVLINRIKNKSDKTKAAILLDEFFKEIENDIKNYILNLIDYILKYTNKILEENNLILEDKANQFKFIENMIVDNGFNKISAKIKEIIENRFPDQKGLYELVMGLFTEDKINNYLFKLLENDNSIQDAMTGIYNQILGPEIDRIEKEDKELNEEFEKYEQEPIKDETPEQHTLSIEEYAKAHSQEKIDELNQVYDDIEKENPNMVPVRDLRDLTPFIDDEEIIPPTEDESDVVINDGTIEIVEYLDGDENQINIE